MSVVIFIFVIICYNSTLLIKYLYVGLPAVLHPYLKYV